MNAVFEADRRYLCVEGEIASHCARFANAAKDFRVALARQQQANRGTLEQTIDEVEGNLQVAGRRKNPQVRHDPYELCDAENRQAPGAVTLGQSLESKERSLMRPGLAPVCVDQYIRIDRDQSRSIKS